MTSRQANPQIPALFLDRWSPRSFDGNPVPQDDLQIMFEAASWAPSAYNSQPWRFLYAVNGDSHWETFLSQLIPFNAGWAKDAGALVFVVSKSMIGDGESAKPSHSHSYDSGAAAMLLALQATEMGYFSHSMTGVLFEQAQTALNIPEGHRLEAAMAIGKRAPLEQLPEALKEREVPSTRNPISDFVVAGPFSAS